MKPKQIFWGTLFISLGMLWLIESTFSTEIDFSAQLKFWPFIFVFIGLSMLSKNQTAKGVFAGLAGIASGAAIFGMLSTPKRFFEYHHKREKGDIIVKKFIHPADEKIKNVEFQLSAGAGSYSIFSSDSNLILVEGEKLNELYSFNFDKSGERARIEMMMNEISIQFDDKNTRNNNIDIVLNPKPAYSLDLEIGAAAAYFDLSRLKLSNLDIKAGAVSLDLLLGEPAKDKMEANIKTGASSIRIVCKKETGVELKVDSPLSTKNIQGLTTIGGDIYRSDNFEKAEKKVYLTLDGGLSDLSVVRN